MERRRRPRDPVRCGEVHRFRSRKAEQTKASSWADGAIADVLCVPWLGFCDLVNPEHNFFYYNKNFLHENFDGI